MEGGVTLLEHFLWDSEEDPLQTWSQCGGGSKDVLS